jgi:hypothetical protein
MNGIVVWTPKGQVTPSLSDFAAKIRNAHDTVRAACSYAVASAITAGDNLANAKKIVGHGYWSEFLRACGFHERTARRYTQLAELVKSNWSFTTDLTGLTIEGAIKKLSPPKPRKATSSRQLAPQFDNRDPTRACFEQDKPPVKHNDIVALWDRTPHEDRIKTIDSIGLQALWAVPPQDWMQEIARRPADRLRGCTPALTTPACVIPADLSIPEFLRRQSPNHAGVTPADPITHSSSADVPRAGALDIGERQ